MSFIHGFRASMRLACVAGLIGLLALPGIGIAQQYDTLSTGAGKDSRVPRRDYSLKLVFANRQGTFLGGIDVAIYDQSGKKIVAAHSPGPWFLIQLPGGDYRVVGRGKDGRGAAAEVTVSEGRQKTVYLTW